MKLAAYLHLYHFQTDHIFIFVFSFLYFIYLLIIIIFFFWYHTPTENRLFNNTDKIPKMLKT